MKKRIKIAVDVAMFVAFLYLTGYHPGAGTLAHGIVGMSLFALFVAHHVLNLGWYRALPKGRYTPMRVLFVVVDFAFLVDMVLMAVSSVLMSELVFAASPIRSTQLGRSLHVGSTAWGFVLMASHLGLHTHAPLSKLERRLSSLPSRLAWGAACALLVVAGGVCLSKSGVAGKLILRTSWLSPAGSAVFYAQLLASVAAFCIVVHWLMKALVKAEFKARGRA